MLSLAAKPNSSIALVAKCIAFVVKQSPIKVHILKKQRQYTNIIRKKKKQECSNKNKVIEQCKHNKAAENERRRSQRCG